MTTPSGNVFRVIVREALTKAKAGQSSIELRLLQNAPYRSMVNWSEFPDFARPSNPEDFVCHEG